MSNAVTPAKKTVSQTQYFSYFPPFLKGGRRDCDSPVLQRHLKSPSIPLYEGEAKLGPVGFCPSITELRHIHESRGPERLKETGFLLPPEWRTTARPTIPVRLTQQHWRPRSPNFSKEGHPLSLPFLKGSARFPPFSKGGRGDFERTIWY